MSLYQSRLPYVSKWFPMTRDQVLDKFMTLNGSYTDGKGQNRFVYVPGTRDDRVLIVAHADTVWGQLPINVKYESGILFSGNRYKKYTVKGRNNTTFNINGVGIGADDRAGCAIAWLLRDLGHSLLITTGEEIGCIASKWIMSNEWWRKELNLNHSFAVQFDRRSKHDIVFYDLGTNKFAAYVKEKTGYKPQTGFNTDIKVLCNKICGVNISVGYYDEHTAQERLVLEQWENTYAMARKWLSEPKFERYEQSWQDKFEVVKKNKKWSQDNYIDDYNYPMCTDTDNKPKSSDIIPARNKSQGLNFHVVCRNRSCNHIMNKMTWFENQFKCTKCDTES